MVTRRDRRWRPTRTFDGGKRARSILARGGRLQHHRRVLPDCAAVIPKAAVPPFSSFWGNPIGAISGIAVTNSPAVPESTDSADTFAE
jgi:hypothetical protein